MANNNQRMNIMQRFVSALFVPYLIWVLKTIPTLEAGWIEKGISFTAFMYIYLVFAGIMTIDDWSN